MQIALASTAFWIAAFCAGVMGFAIQRGGTCTVVAVGSLVAERSAERLLSLLEASLWVGGSLVVAEAFHVLPPMPTAYATSAWTVAGGALLGIGATINGACVLGAVARFGSGEWAYLLTPFGFYLGCISVKAVFGDVVADPLADPSPVLRAAPWLVAPFLAFAVWRIARGLRQVAQHAKAGSNADAAAAHRAARLAAHVWSPHVATTVIAAAFVLLVLVAGTWAYTDVIAELARGMARDLHARVLLAAALLAGAALGGWTEGRVRQRRSLVLAQCARCLAGGLLMGWGSLLLPGGNDGLVLLAMPLGWPYAWIAFATMCATIAAAHLAPRPS